MNPPDSSNQEEAVSVLAMNPPKFALNPLLLFSAAAAQLCHC